MEIIIIIKKQKNFLAAIEICRRKILAEANTKYGYILAKALEFADWQIVFLTLRLDSHIYAHIYEKVDAQKNVYIHLFASSLPPKTYLLTHKYILETLSLQFSFKK